MSNVFIFPRYEDENEASQESSFLLYSERKIFTSRDESNGYFDNKVSCLYTNCFRNLKDLLSREILYSVFPLYPRLARFGSFSHFMKFFWGEKICKMNLRNFLSCLFFVVVFHKHRSCTHYRFYKPH